MTWTYEPPRADLPVGVSTGRLFGVFTIAIDDGTDEGILTDAIPASGSITFTPDVAYIDYDNTLILMKPRTAHLTGGGEFEIDLVSTDNTAPVNNWTYWVAFNIPGLPIPSFRITVPAGSNRSLATVVPRVSNESYVVTKGDKGDKGDMSIFGVNTFVDGDGDLALNDQQMILWGSGAPNGVLTKPKGTLYVDIAASVAPYLYFKKTVSGNTGWEGIS